jgi:hypothetical protein
MVAGFAEKKDLLVQRLDSNASEVTDVGFEQVIDFSWITGEPSTIQSASIGRQFSGRTIRELGIVAIASKQSTAQVVRYASLSAIIGSTLVARRAGR